MKKHLVLLAVALIAAANLETVRPSGPAAPKRNPAAMHDAPDAAIAPDDPIDDVVEKVVHLDQNWSKQQRDTFYTLTQGSRLIPYDWFLHVEHADRPEPFRSVSNMNRYRYLTQKPSKLNPDALPVGFVKDPGEKQDWLGLTCAACHTAQIHFKKIAFRIDGGPAMADHDQFLIDLTKALRATVNSEEKFQRFAKKVLGENPPPANTQKLKSDLDDFTRQRESYNDRNKTDLPYGYARLDAFGRIMNETMTRHIGLGNSNAQSPNAPVSYPHLWDTPHYDRVQWNGVAQNDKLFGPLGRNVGEVLGVFGSVTIPNNVLDPRFASSVNLKNLHWLEASVADLWSPRWPDAFGKLDADKITAGKKLFQMHCVKCHDSSADPEDPRRVLKASLHSLQEAGTDPRMAKNFVERVGLTGKLQGRKFFDPTKGVVEIGKEDKAGVLLLALVNGTILGADRTDRIALLQEALEHLESKLQAGKLDLKEGLQKYRSLTKLSLALSFGLPDQIETLQKLEVESRRVIGSIFGDMKAQPPLHYKAGALNGVWATAPYLHNGSVANLWELLLPPMQRSPRFTMGSREFDTQRVGFRSAGYQPNGGFVLDTTIDGNRNTGHDYNNATLSDDDRWALIEYLKSL